MPALKTKTRSRLTELFSVVDAGVLERFMRANKHALMRYGKMHLDNIPQSKAKLLALAMQIPASEYPRLYDAVLPSAPPDLPDLGTSLEGLNAPETTSIADGDSNVYRWCVLLAMLRRDSDAMIESFLTGARSPQPELPAVVPNAKDLSSQPDNLAAYATQAPAPIQRYEMVDEDQDEVVARGKNLLHEHAAFAEVVGVRRGTRWYRTDDASLRRQLFPQSGDIYITGDKPPRFGEIGAWKVHRQEQSAGAAFKAVTEIAPVYQVVSVPASSSEYGRVREWLKDRGEVTTAKQLFRFQDGLSVRFQTSTLLSVSDFQTPLDAWQALPSLQSRAGEIVIGPLPAPDTVYELCDAAILVRRTLKQAEIFSHFPKFTKSQVAQLSNWLRERADAASTSLRIDEIFDTLNDIATQQELLAEFFPRLFEHPLIKEKIDHHIKDLEGRLLKDKESVVAKNRELVRERDRLQDQIETLKSRQTEIGQKVAKAVRRGFDRAVADGEKMLADVAVFSALLPRHAKTKAIDGSERQVEPIEVERLIGNQPLSLKEAIAEFHLPRLAAARIEYMMKVAIAAGLFVIFRGGGAAFLAEHLSRRMTRTNGAIVRINPGLFTGTQFKALIEEAADFDFLCLLQANASPLDAYASQLGSLVWHRVVFGDVSRAPVIFLAEIDGPIALPTPRSVQQLAITIDIDAPLEEPDVGLTRDSWSGETLEYLRAKGMRSPFASQIIQRVSEVLPEDDDAELLTSLRAAMTVALCY